MKPSRFNYVLLAVGLGYSSTALAQEQTWLKDRRYQEGIGIRTGDLELHPGVGAEFGYDSNYFLRSGTVNATTNEPTIASLRLRISPSFSLSTLSEARRSEGTDGIAEPPKVTFRAGAGATFNEFFATKSQYSDIMKEQRNVGAIGNLQLNILPQRPFGADLGADFLRTVQPSNNPEFNFNRITARFGGGVTWTPGGGMFDWRFGYDYNVTYFEDVNFRSNSNHSNEISTRGRWRFLPRTAFLFDGSLNFTRYDYQTVLSNSDPVRARVGLNGLVTSSFALLAMVGWGASFYSAANASQFDSVLAQAEIKWYITPNPGLDPTGAALSLSSLSLGYTRDFFNSYLGSFYTRNRGYGSLSYFFGGQFLVVIDGGVSAISYPQNNINLPPIAPFTTVYVDPTLFAEYRFANTLGLNTTVRYSANLTNQSIGGDELKWNRFEAFLGLRWFM